MLDLQIVKTSELKNFCDNNIYDAVIVMPAIKMALAKSLAKVLIDRANHPGLLVIANDDRGLGFISTANKIYERTNSRYFAYIAQDAFPGKDWLALAMKKMKKSGAGLLAFNDGKWFGSLASFGLVDRIFTNSLYKNLLFYPEYKSHFADTELSIIAKNANTLAYDPDCVMIEVDYLKHSRYQNRADKKLFNQRNQNGFPLIA